jgi:hypothetical protein
MTSTTADIVVPAVAAETPYSAPSNGRSGCVMYMSANTATAANAIAAKPGACPRPTTP